MTGPENVEHPILGLETDERSEQGSVQRLSAKPFPQGVHEAS